MPTQSSFEYAIVRVVPRVERGEFINAGVILYCAERESLAARVELSEARLRALCPDVELEIVEGHLGAIVKICAGEGPIGKLPQRERWRWLVAPRSTIIQTSPAHAGLCEDPEAALSKLVRDLVRV